MARPLEVAIVGAGLAGLRCADVLLRHGVKVTIFEARNRIGGRVAQSKHLGHLVDLGPNWIHGAESSPISELARKTGTVVSSWDDEDVYYQSDGRLMDASEAKEYGRILYDDDGLINQAARYSGDSFDSIDPHHSLESFLEDKFGDLFSHETPDQAKRKRATLLQVANTLGGWVGTPISKVSLRNFWIEDWLSGENVFVAETYSKILDEVAKTARAKAEIKLESEVTGIHSHSEGRISIQTTNSLTEKFDEVVVTAPLGWLKQNQSVFNPRLPERLSKAIGNIGYGTLDKIYITFPSPFWDRPSSEDQPHSSKADTTPSARNKEAWAGQHRAGFTHWLSPSYGKETNPDRWCQEAMNLASLPATCAHATWLFYISGPCSVRIAELVADARDETERDEKLIAFVKPYLSLLPNYDEADPACKPKAVLATAWVNDKFAGHGSYSNFQVGCGNGEEDVAVIRHGMPQCGIWFAGEHTAPIEDLATTTGAYRSGEAVAGRIAEKHELRDQSS